MSIPPQYFQSIIALELAVTGALLWQIHYFEHDPVSEVRGRALPHPVVRGLVAVVLLSTILGSLLGIVYEDKWIAVVVGAGFMCSLLPILLRFLPSLTDERTGEHQSSTAMTVVGLLVCILIAAAFVIALLGS